MMKKIAFLFLIFSKCCYAALVSGYLIDSQRNPLHNVLVKSTSSKIALSDNSGYFRINATEKDSVLFHRIGYKDTIYAADRIPEEIILQKLSITLPGSFVEGQKLSESQNIKVKRIKIDEESLGKTLTELIEKESGLISKEVKTKGSRQTLAIPGFDARHTLVMIDGIPLNTSGEAVDLSLIPLSLVDDIEIIPGNLTVKSASGSMGAVLNIRTKQNQKDFLCELSQEAGSYEYYKTTLLAALGKKWMDIQVSADIQQAENDFEYDVPEFWNLQEKTKTRENNSFKQIDLSGKLKFQFKNNVMEYKIFYTDFFRMLPGTVNNPELFYKARISGYMNRQQLQYKKHLKGYNLSTDFWLNQEKSFYDNTRLEYPFNNYPIYFIYGKSNKKNMGARPSIETILKNNLKFVLGTEFQRESYEYCERTNPSNSIDYTYRDTWSEFINLNWNRNLEILDAGLYFSLRNDYNPEFDDFWSYNTGANLKFLDLYELSILYGSSYTMPSFHNLYWKGDAESVGNPDLLPEKNNSFQSQIDFHYSNLNLRMKYRHDELDDMIDWVQTFTNAWKPINISSAIVQNIEISAEYEPLNSLIFTSIWNRTISEDRTILESGEEAASYGKELIYTPDYNAKISVNYRFSGFNFKLETELTGSQWTTRDQLTNEKQIEAYQLYNAGLKYDFELFKTDVSIGLSVNNILNEFYQLYDYIPQPGRNYILSINIKRRTK